MSPVQVRPPLLHSFFPDESIDQYHSDMEWWSKSQLWTLRSPGPSAFLTWPPSTCRAGHMLIGPHGACRRPEAVTQAAWSRTLFPYALPARFRFTVNQDSRPMPS